MNSGSEERIDSVPWQYKISEKMESANRGEAERCLRFAKSTKDVGKARRFAEKSYRLCPTPECRGGFSLVGYSIYHTPPYKSGPSK